MNEMTLMEAARRLDRPKATLETWRGKGWIVAMRREPPVGQAHWMMTEDEFARIKGNVEANRPAWYGLPAVVSVDSSANGVESLASR